MEWACCSVNFSERPPSLVVRVANRVIPFVIPQFGLTEHEVHIERRDDGYRILQFTGLNARVVSENRS